MTQKRSVGRTREAGYQIGARRTFPLSMKDAWDLVLSPKGLTAWLGGAPRLRHAPGATYRLGDGTRGEIRVFRPRSHLRITWQPRGWARPSLIQVRVIAAARGTTISFHQEHLPDARRRAERRRHFLAALGKLGGEA